MIDFERPGFLLLLPLAIALIVLGRRGSLTGWSRPRMTVCLTMRMILAALIILALAGPRTVLGTRQPAVVFLRDVSASLDPAAQQKAQDFIARSTTGAPGPWAEVVFAREPALVRTSSAPAENAKAPSPNADATSHARALEFARAILPSDQPGRIVLFSDGVTTVGPPLEEFVAQDGQPLEIDTVALPARTAPDLAVTEITVPEAVREGEIFNLTAKVQSTTAARATFRLYQNDLLSKEDTRELAAGENILTFPQLRAEGRFARYELEARLEGDSVPENDRRMVTAAHGGSARVLIVDRQPEESEILAKTLRLGGFEVEVRPPTGFPTRLAEMEGFDLAIFSDAPATAFSDPQLQMLREWVQKFGGGFLMIGGEESFGAGGYFRTPVAALLPVRIEREEREETPVIALLVILDRSGSMTAPAGGRTKMALANDGAILAMDVLQSRDLFGLFAVDTRVQDVVPLDRVSDKAAAARRIAAITAGGGGIYIYTSLAEAYPRLRDADAKIKHIILFSDAADAEEKSAGPRTESPLPGGSALDLANALLASRITLSVVALGTEQDRDTAFLRQLSAQGGGRFYLTNDAATLPRLFTMETMRAAESSLREEAFFVQAADQHTALAGVDWSQAPLLLGRNVASLKPGAELLLQDEAGHPLLALWRSGLGQSAAFLSDAKARWGAEWLAWDGYAKFWTQLARQLARPDSRSDLFARVREEDTALVIEVDAMTAEGDFRDGLTVTAATPDATPTVVPQTGPGRYEVRLAKPETDTTLLAVGDGQGRPVSLAWSRSYPAEFLPAADGQPALREISARSGGTFEPAPEDAFRLTRHEAFGRKSLAGFFLGAALLLWPLDIWLRRKEWQTPVGNSLRPFSHAK